MVFYQCMTELVIGSKARPIILVDWSGIPNSQRQAKDGEYFILKATLANEGRGITLYDEIHPKKKEGNAKVHEKFLANLRYYCPRDVVRLL